MSIDKSIFLLFIIFSINLNAQSSYTIIGLIQDSDGGPMAYSNVLLLKANDSTLVKGTLAQEDGTFEMDNVISGSYIVQGSMIGYKSTNSQPFELNNDYKVETIVLSGFEALDEVVLVAKKQLFEQKVDRMVINVASSIVSSGGSALEILERSPGVLVNRQSNGISLAGKDGVVIMINGKTSYVPASSIVQMLEGMSADNIESIELITTPPANLDAEGNAGFINIVLKKRTDLGLNGSYSLSAGYGDGETTSDNINFNYRKNKINLFGSYSFSLDKRAQIMSTSREYEEEGNLLSSKTVTNRDPRQRDHNMRIGLDVQVTEKTISGVLITAFDNRWSMDAFNESFDTENGLPISFVDLVNSEINHLKHYGVNFNVKHNFTKDKFISFDLDYLNYEFNNPTDYTNSFYDGDRIFINEELLRSRKNTPLYTWVSKFDYSNKVNDKLILEFGVKGTKNNFENVVSIEDLFDDLWVIDPSLTNMSQLDEKIFAGYGALDYSFTEKTSIKLGLRYEYTNTVLDTDTEGTVVDRQYGEWFPSVFLNRKFNDNLSMNISYSRRITRPTFNDLAPFIIFFDPNTFFSGNASLQPAISNSAKYAINYKSYFFSLQYTNEEGSIARFQEFIDEDTGRLIFELSNLDFTKTFTTTLGFPLKISNWWRTQNNLTYVRQKVRAFYNEEPIELSLGNFSANSTHSFKISNSFSTEVSGFYNGPGFFGSAKYDEVYGINIGFQQKFSDKWGTLKFSINDVLDSVEFTGGTDLPEQNIKTENLFDFSNRTFTLTYSRNFGNQKLQSKRERETGSEEERRRVN